MPPCCSCESGHGSTAIWGRLKACTKRAKIGFRERDIGRLGIVEQRSPVRALAAGRAFASMGPGGALGRARWLWRAERTVHLPSEAWLQHLILPHPLIVQAFDMYYDMLHFPVLITRLVWLFVWHRERYGRFRITLVAFTGLCLLIQLIPVAPPRMLTGIGMVDTAALYGQSVFSWSAAPTPISCRLCHRCTSAGRSWSPPR